MKVCIFGAGAVGGHFAARLSAAKLSEVSIIARGAQLEAIRNKGLLLKSGSDQVRGMPNHATDDPASLPPQDVVLVTMKSYTLPALVDTLARLAAPNGCIVFGLNGIPWWWRYGLKGPQSHLPLLDPEGVLWSKLREKTLGCVMYSPNDVESPGVILHQGGNRYVFGEPDGTASEPGDDPGGQQDDDRCQRPPDEPVGQLGQRLVLGGVPHGLADRPGVDAACLDEAGVVRWGRQHHRGPTVARDPMAAQGSGDRPGSRVKLR